MTNEKIKEFWHETKLCIVFALGFCVALFGSQLILPFILEKNIEHYCNSPITAKQSNSEP